MMFGETIVGIAGYFTRDHFSLASLLIFASVVGLFFTYILEFDHLIDENQTKQTGNLMIYLHYFILFGISLFTVALEFISEPAVHPAFTATCLFSGIGLFYIGLWLANHYNHLVIPPAIIITFALTTIAGFFVSLSWHTFTVFATTAVVVVLVNAVLLTTYNAIHQ